jgi:hypothetical protein
VFCPGWLGDESATREATCRFFALLETVLAPLRDRIRVARIAVQWPSTPFGDAVQGSSDDADDLLPTLRHDRNGAREGMDSRVRQLLVDVARAEVPTSPEEEAELDRLLRELTNPVEPAASPSWPFHALSFWMMKRRAGSVGERLGRECIAPLWGALPHAPRLHLVGHSFGATLLSSAVLGGARPESLTLLLAAFSAFAFAPEVPGFGRPGRYHRVVAERQVQGPVVVLRSDHDTGLATFYRAAVPPAEAARYRAPGTALRRTAATVATSGLGAVGARAVGAPSIDLLDAQRSGIPSYPIVNVDGSRVVRACVPLVGAHRDVFHPEIATLVGMAAGLIVGGPQGARPVPLDPLFRP